jgi:hypothetical protein
MVAWVAPPRTAPAAVALIGGSDQHAHRRERITGLMSPAIRQQDREGRAATVQ